MKKLYKKIIEIVKLLKKLENYAIDVKMAHIDVCVQTAT